MTKTFEALSRIGVVPVITIDRPQDAVPLARALLNGGIGCAEITFRTASGKRRYRGSVANVTRCSSAPVLC